MAATANQGGAGPLERRRLSSRPIAASSAREAVNPARKYQALNTCDNRVDRSIRLPTKPNGLIKNRSEADNTATGGPKPSKQRRKRRRRSRAMPAIAAA